MSEWISVEQKEPDDQEKMVLAYSSLINEVIRSKARCFIEHGISHWMPLPEPPELEGPFFWTGEFIQYIKCGQIMYSFRPNDPEFLVKWINRVLAVES